MPLFFRAIYVALLLTAGPAAAHVDHGLDLIEVDRRVRVGQIQVLRAPHDAGGRARLVLAYLDRTRLTGDWSDFDRAEKALEDAPGPPHPELLWAAAQVHAFAHRFGEALDVALQLQRLAPDDWRGYAAAGDALLETGDLGAARAQYGRLDNLGRTFDSLARLARAAHVAGQTDSAAAFYREAIGLADSARARWARTRLAALEIERYAMDEGRALLDTVLAAGPDEDAWGQLGLLGVLRGDYAVADSAYGAAFALRPGPEQAAAWAVVLRRANAARADTLERVAHDALQAYVARGREAFLRPLALLLLRRGGQEEVALDLARRDTLLRRDTQGLEVLAWAYQANGRLAEAWDTIKEALTRPDVGGTAFYRAGRIALARGDTTEAYDLQGQALARDRYLENRVFLLCGELGQPFPGRGRERAAR